MSNLNQQLPKAWLAAKTPIVAAGAFPNEVDHMPGSVLRTPETNGQAFLDYKLWSNFANSVNSKIYGDNAETQHYGQKVFMQMHGIRFAEFDKTLNKGWVETNGKNLIKFGIGASTTLEANWWDEMSEEHKSEYVAEHPNSKYADLHKQAKDKEVPKSEPSKSEPKSEPAQSTAPETQPGLAAAKEALKTPEMQAGSSLRKRLALMLKAKSHDVVSHLKHEVKEWKHAGHALSGLARGRKLDEHDKKAIAAVAADIAAVTIGLITGGHLAHGIAALLSHAGTHIIQESLVKAAVKGVVHHASLRTLSSSEDDEDQDMDKITNDAIKLLIEEIENGDLAKYLKEPDQGNAPSQKPSAKDTKVEARIDMSAEVAGRGLCPECKKPMKIVMSSGTKVWACAADRIAFPVPNGN